MTSALNESSWVGGRRPFNEFGWFGAIEPSNSLNPLNLLNLLNPSSDAIAPEPRGQDGLEIGFGPCAGEIQIGFAQCVDRRANHVRPADGHAAGGADVGAEAIE